MTGICEGCPSSLLTVKLAVEATIRELAPEVATIDVEGITDTGAAAIKSKGLKDDLSSVEPSWISIDNPEEFPSDKLTPAKAGGLSIVLFRSKEGSTPIATPVRYAVQRFRAAALLTACWSVHLAGGAMIPGWRAAKRRAARRTSSQSPYSKTTTASE